MCGIAGIVSLSGRALTADAEECVRRMSNRLQHRGPDDEGIFTDPTRTVVLGHRRLAIIDPTAEAHQPMTTPGGNAISFNGEIYNFRELARQHALGPSSSDTAILLQLLDRDGTRALPELVGFFSFAHWDASRKRLTIARDRFGKKPIYYYTTGNTLLFASELGALISSGLLPRELSKESLAGYLRYYNVPHPLTPLPGVQCLPPATVMQIEARGNAAHVSKHAWWSVPKKETAEISYAEAVKGMRERLERSIEYRMVSDVPVGAFLSAGLDSNAIVGLMAQRSPHLRTFTIGFSGATDSETSLARISAEHFKTEHHDHTYSDEDVAELLPRFFASMDSPTGDGLNSFLVAHFARSADPKIKVVVTGAGGDELFLGYKKYRWMAKHPLTTRLTRDLPLPKFVRSWLSQMNRPAASLLRGLIRPGEIRTLFSDQEITELLGMQPQAPVQTIASLEDLLVSDLQHYLPDMLLRDLDVFTMSHGLEARVPLLDAELQRFVWQLPAEHLRKGDTKQLLIDAVRDVLPPELLNRPKTGFEIPLGRWLRLGALRPLLDRLASGELALVRDGILRREAVAHTHAEFIHGRSHYLKPWSIIALDEWYRHFTQESAS